MCKAKLFLSMASATLLVTSALPGQAGERVSLETSASGLAPSNGIALNVSGAKGRYERVEAGSLVLPLSLHGEVTDADPRMKIVKSLVYLKSEGAPADGDGEKRDEAGLDGGPARRIDANSVALSSLASNGPTAQDAIAACNRLSAAERNTDGGETVLMSVPVVWQVTTGRFSFNWKNYDRVGPSEEIVKNIDFYRDREDVRHETAITAAVKCQPLGEPAVAKASEPAPEARAKAKGKAPTPVTVEAAPEPAAPQPVKTALVQEDRKPRCDGGMVRETSSDSGYLCLCPGNTTRIEKGDTGFACVRRRHR